MSHIAIIGAGRVGSTVAYTLIIKNIAERISLVDVNQDRCEGEVLDLKDVLAFSTTKEVAVATYAEARTADIIVICAGFAQQPGQTRPELLAKNKTIIADIMRNLNPINSNAIVIMVTNPVDVLTYVAHENTALPQKQVIGSGTLLDMQRLQHALAREFAVDPSLVETLIMGEHGDSQCVIWSQTRIEGKPADQLLARERHVGLAETTRKTAYTIIEKKCATYYGVASCVAELCSIILNDKKSVVPVVTYLPAFGLCMSIPVVLGRAGVLEQRLPPLAAEEHTCLAQSAKNLRKLLHS